MEIEFIFGVFAVVASGALMFILKRLFDVYTKQEVHDLIKNVLDKGKR